MASDFSRIDRIQDFMQASLATIIQQEINDPRLAKMVTVTGVIVSKDMKHAKVYVTVLPDDKAKESVRILNNAAGFIRTTLAKRVTFRSLPNLRFYYDDTTIQANRVGKLLDEVSPFNASPAEEDNDNNSE
ncbi:MAG: 30S ribosome-binding factor RbfA [Candidatus Berkiella sp.]